MRKNTIFCLLAALLLIVSAVGTTFATVQVVGTNVNVINVATIKAQIVEEYERAEGIYPGNTVAKVVNVKNTGNSDCIVRVKVEKAWGSGRGEDGKLIPIDPAMSTDNILIEYNTEYWRYDPVDGYFYYIGVLKPDQTTLEPLFEEFKISEETGNEYAGLEGDIFIKMECVQVEANGASVWGKTLTDLGIEYVPGPKVDITTQAKLTGENPDYEFTFNPESTDLFSDFKDLLPGETRSQTIEIKNETTGHFEIGVKAVPVDQSLATPETLALVDKLLKEYATIVITDETTGRVIYTGPVWGNLGVDPFEYHGKTMEHTIPLGTFGPDVSKNLNVQLQLDPVVGNDYQNLWGLIKWEWSANKIPNNEEIEISGQKTWVHGTNPADKQPTSITINLMSDGDIIESKTVTAADDWKWTFTAPKYDIDENEIVYTIDEVDVPGYDKEVIGYNVKNTYIETEPETVEIKGQKTWVHGTNPNDKQPTSITINLMSGTTVVASKTVTAADDWKWSFTANKYDADGNEIVYTIDEVNVPGYDKEVIGYNVKNTYIETEPETVVVSGVKTWVHGTNPTDKQPTSITVNIKVGNIVVATKNVTVADDWKWSFTLPKFDATGNVIVYTVDEEAVDGYNKKIDGNNITNTFLEEPETVIINGTKTWKHGTNPADKQPTEITINIKVGEQVIISEKVTAENHWKWSFELPKHDAAGKEIAYTVDEVDVPGYTKTIDGTNITNEYDAPEEVEINGSKTWDHGSNTARPTSIVVYIKNGNEVVAAKRVTETDGWKWTFTLPKFDADGKEIKYTIEEETLKNYKLEKVDGFNLHNKFISTDYPGDPTPNNPQPGIPTPTTPGTYTPPKTGDAMNLALWVLLMVGSFSMLVVLGKKRKELKAK